MAHSFRYLMLVLAGALPAFAQTPAPPQPVRFTVFSARPIADVSFVPRANTAAQKLVFYPTARSPRYEYRGTAPIRFTEAASGRVVAEASIPADVRDALLLFVPIEPAPASGLRYQISVLDDGAARHGPGGLAIINLSGLALSGTVGPHAVILKAGLNPTLAIGNSARIVLRTAVKNRTYQSYTDAVEMDRSQRALLILFPPYYRGSIEVQSRMLLDEPPAALRPSPTR